MRRAHRPLLLKGRAAPIVVPDLFTYATCIWSVRKTRAAYAGSCLQLRRGGDNATQAFGFVGGVGSLVDIAAAITWAAGGDGSAYLSEWYEQNGTGILMSQTTNAQQPRVINAGVAEVIGTAPAFKFDGSDDSIATGIHASLCPGTGDFCVEVRYRTSASQVLIETIWEGRSAGNNLMDLIYNYGPGDPQYNSDAVNFGVGGAVANSTSYHDETNRISGSVKHYLNGVYGGVAAASAKNLNNRRIRLGRDYNDTSQFTGLMNEVIVTTGASVHSAAFTPAAAP